MVWMDFGWRRRTILSSTPQIEWWVSPSHDHSAPTKQHDLWSLQVLWSLQILWVLSDRLTNFLQGSTSTNMRFQKILQKSPHHEEQQFPATLLRFPLNLQVASTMKVETMTTSTLRRLPMNSTTYPKDLNKLPWMTSDFNPPSLNIKKGINGMRVNMVSSI